jgi:hypothetical protein
VRETYSEAPGSLYKGFAGSLGGEAESTRKRLKRRVMNVMATGRKSSQMAVSTA